MRIDWVEKGLQKLVENAKKEIPLLSEIRVFGSYNNGNWNPRKSDIDVLTEIDDEGYSVFKDRIKIVHSFFEIDQRRELSKKLQNELEEEFAKRLDLHLLSKKDVKIICNDYSSRSRDFGKNIKAGRLLYPNNLPIVIY
ncbi:nucleotidyltransferase domain-containing protein [Candidatus Pacearchaeota archaeon]|nr:nucleotidyltransferase domain-containing protein [Candidatus Pacearchaeota archaeon]